MPALNEPESEEVRAQRRVTVRDVAREAGVSVVPVLRDRMAAEAPRPATIRLVPVPRGSVRRPGV